MRDYLTDFELMIHQGWQRYAIVHSETREVPVYTFAIA